MRILLQITDSSASKWSWSPTRHKFRILGIRSLNICICRQHVYSASMELLKDYTWWGGVGRGRGWGREAKNQTIWSENLLFKIQSNKMTGPKMLYFILNALSTHDFCHFSVSLWGSRRLSSLGIHPFLASVAVETSLLHSTGTFWLSEFTAIFLKYS